MAKARRGSHGKRALSHSVKKILRRNGASNIKCKKVKRKQESVGPQKQRQDTDYKLKKYGGNTGRRGDDVEMKEPKATAARREAHAALGKQLRQESLAKRRGISLSADAGAAAAALGGDDADGGRLDGGAAADAAERALASAPPAQRSFHRELSRVLQMADVLIEVLDARDPMGCRCMPLEDAVLQRWTSKRVVLLLNKADLVADADLVRIEARLRAINAVAPLQRCRHSHVDVDSVLGIRGFDLDRALQASPQLLDVDAAPTKHDAAVTSVSLDQGAARHVRRVAAGELDLELADAWLQRLLREQGADIFRMKGVLAIAHAQKAFVFHAVHMHFEGSFSQEWADGEPRHSKLVFIGKNLDGAALARGFDSCLATPENLRAKAAALRFAVGDIVEYKVDGARWRRGTVVNQLFRDDSMPAGVVAAYSVQVDGAGLVWAFEDDDCVIRAPRGRWAWLPGSGGGGHARHNGHSHRHGHHGSAAGGTLVWCWSLFFAAAAALAPAFLAVYVIQ